MRHGRLAIGLGVLLTAILILAACAGTLEPTEAPAEEPTEAPEKEPTEAVPVEAAPLPWDDRYKVAEPDLCPPHIECEEEIDFAAPTMHVLYEGRLVWVRRGLFINAQGEAFGINVTGVTSRAVTDYTDRVKVCLDQVFTGGDTKGTPSELGLGLLPDGFGANSEDVSIEIYLLAAEESKGDYAIDFVIDPTVTDGGTHHYQQKYATKAYANVSVAGSQGGGAVGAELFRNTESVGETHVERGSALESDELSLNTGQMGAWWDLAVRGEDEGTYRVSGRYDYPASWESEYRDVPPCESPAICLELSPGQSEIYTISHDTEESPIPNLDVLLLFDASLSMSEEIDSVRENALEIMDKVREEVPDAAFGVASFTDYPGYYEYGGYADTYGDADDYPWNLDQDITTDADAVQRSLDALETSLLGEDHPESYTRALSETLDVSWRPGAKRVVVLFGDSVPHDTDFFMADFDWNTGVDPGQDGIPGTADDLAYAEVVGWLKDQEIEVIAINSAPESHWIYPRALASFEYVAEETGGQMYALANAADAPETVVSGLKAATAQYNRLMVVPDNLPRGLWVTVNPWAYEGAGGGESRYLFDVTVTAPMGSWPGVYEFNLTVLGDNLPLEVFDVMVYVK